jgi:hypothetical protein
MARDGARIRSAFAAFQNVALKDYDAFHRVSDDREYSNYACAGAVYEYLDREEGRDAAIETASAFYGAETRADGAKKLGISEKELLARTRRWLGA